MERGLLWLPLLGVFIWLAWAGWNEYQKLEAYKQWAATFERAKYDIYAVLGQQGDRLVWGKPTRQGPVALQEVTLSALQTLTLYSAERPLPEKANLPKGCTIAIGLELDDNTQQWIPFTDADLALAWKNQLQTLQESLQSTPQT
ncbi:hypothetical protein [Leptolyngbya iicbica]|uniref:Uncharacterized protein n=2 Tax=Cyanophyceae TaxID=3028117 RepID=A0A4Q7E1S0_9CYAN|nr:hypothetical protein [Leptolyngbya sp. LK]RZM76145.1 hypothetical protein DYY88_19915 [Leptolyngbya sp. LK]